jgi:chloride channel 3/4/5
MILSLALATVIRTFFVILSYGTKVPAGIFVPSMAIGATFGRMVGISVQALHESFPDSKFFAACAPDVPCITPGTYAFLGAGAALSGIMHITVSVVVIMFELTGALTYILPTMVSIPSMAVNWAINLYPDCCWNHQSHQRPYEQGWHC